MNRFSLGRGFLSAAVVLGCFSAPTVQADDSAPNPRYTAWSKFKPGSYATVEADMDSQGHKYHITTTRTLVSVDAGKAVIETKSTANIMGHVYDAPVRTTTILAKGDPESSRQTGEKDVQAMGKTFKCKVYDAGGKANGQPNKPGADPDDMKATVYVSEDVPGGLVKLEANGENGRSLTFVLTAMQSK